MRLPALAIWLACSGLFGVARAQDAQPAVQQAQALAASGRADEAVATLLAKVDDPEAGPQARDALLALLLTEPPRRAWGPAYAAASQGATTDERAALRAQAALADLDHPSSRARALQVLQQLVAQRPNDDRLRLRTAQALLEGGRPTQARRLVGSRTGADYDAVVVAALLADGKVDAARKRDESAIPRSCAVNPSALACASGLAELGYPGAAAYRLRTALRTGDDGLRDSTAQANAWSRIATIAEEQGDLPAAVRAWKKAAERAPDNRIYAERYATLLALTGQGALAEQAAEGASPRAGNTVKAVRLARSVDPGARSPEVDAAIQQARELDPDHPAVAQAYAHWLLARERPDEALGALRPHLDSRVSDAAFLDLWVWAASTSDDPEAAADAVARSLQTTQDPRRWQDRLGQLSSLHVYAAEKAKAAGDLDRAAARYADALATQPDSVRARVGLGGVRWMAGDLPGATTAYREALQRAPGNRTALFALVELLQLQGREGIARRVLLESGYDDLKVRELEQELAVMGQTHKARTLRSQGKLDAALAEYEHLLVTWPDQAPLLHAYADTLADSGRHVEAAETYARARTLDPLNPWLLLGEVRALTALGQPEDAARLLSRLPDVGDTEALTAAVLAAETSIDQARAEQLLKQGRDAEALALLQARLDAAATSENAGAYVAIGDLYRSRWQHAAAATWYDAALELDPDNEAAQRGLVRAELGLGRLNAAESRAQDLAVRSPSPDNTALVREVRHRRTLDRAAAAAARGEHVLAERLLLEEIALTPGDLDLRVAHARLLLARGEAEAALHEAQGVLATNPVHPGALAAVQSAAIALGESDRALADYERAVSAGGPDWIGGELGTLRLAARLDDAREAHESGPPERAPALVSDATDFYGNDNPRRWVLLGGAWLDIDRPQKALEAYELARAMDPDDPTATTGLAATWETLGQPARAEGVLQRGWDETGHPQLGVALYQLQQRRNKPDAARQTRAELGEVAEDGVLVYAEGSPPAPLPATSPPGRSVDASQSTRSPDGPSWSTALLREIDAQSSDLTPLRLTLGGGWLGRPGNAGEQFLNVAYLPFAVALDLPGPIELRGEAVGVQLTDGVREVGGSSLSGALAVGLPGGWSAEVRLGRDVIVSPGFEAMTTWVLSASGPVTGGLRIGVDAGRAPATDSLTAWAGSFTANGAPIGRVFDSWAGGEIGYGWANSSVVGAVGRVGYSDDLPIGDNPGAMGQVPWRQLVAYGRTPLRANERTATWAGFQGILLDHDRQVDGFGVGQGGIFTPDLFATGLARLEAAWWGAQGKLAACGGGGIGPQVVQGDQTLFLFPGTYVAYALDAQVQADLGRNLWLTGTAAHAGSFGAWGQTGVFAQVRYGAPGTLASPSTAFGSLIHGPPLSQPAACPASPPEVTR